MNSLKAEQGIISMDQGKISDYLGKLQSHIHVIPLNLGFEKGVGNFTLP
jgi:hypothetical protein